MINGKVNSGHTKIKKALVQLRMMPGPQFCLQYDKGSGKSAVCNTPGFYDRMHTIVYVPLLFFGYTKLSTCAPPDVTKSESPAHY